MPALAWIAGVGIVSFVGGLVSGSSISGVVKPIIIGGAVYYIYTVVK